MKTARGKEYRVTVERDLLKIYPQLSLLPSYIPSDTFTDFVSAIEDRPERMTVSLQDGVVIVSSKNPIIHRRLDYLGLEIPDPKLQEICEIIREDTGRDPRRDTIYAERSSIFANLPESARVHQRNGIPGAPGKRHPLDPVSSEEITIRRELAETRWSRHKRYRRTATAKEAAEAEQKIAEVKRYFSRYKE